MLVLGEEFKVAIEQLEKENKELKEQCEEEKRKALKTSRELEELVYILSHDLRSPLNHISGFTGLLSDNIQDKISEEEKYYLSTIIESAHHLGRLLDSLLAFSRIARLEMYHIEVALNQLIDEILDLMQVNIMGRKIEWDIQELPSVFGDPVMLRQTITYLIDNAVKFSKNQQTALISIHHLPELEQEGEVVFSVQDNGVGFAPEFEEKVFQVFKKLHHVDEFEGIGIGLANTKRIVERHGGRVWSKSQEGEGSTFFVALPRYKG